MNIYEIVSLNIQNKLKSMSNEEEYLKEYPNMKPIEYLIKYSGITSKRLNNILNCKGKIRISEIAVIAKTLRLTPNELLIKNNQDFMS